MKATSLRKVLPAIFIFIMLISFPGCIRVSDLVNQIPALFLTSYLVSFAAFSRKRISSVFLSVVSGFCLLLLVYFSVQRISDALGTTLANYLTWFLIQIIPFLIYTWLCALGLISLRKRYPKKFHELHNALLSGIPSSIVLVLYLGFLFSGFCYDCYISNTFQHVFGWPFDLLDQIK
jgi:hypothetical protein